MGSEQPPVPLKGLEVWACEWEDAHWNSDEFNRDEITHRPINYVTVGIKLFDDETGVSLSTDLCETGTFRGINFIPAKMIVRSWKLGNLKPASPRSPRKPKVQSPLKSIPTTSNKQSFEPD